MVVRTYFKLKMGGEVSVSKIEGGFRKRDFFDLVLIINIHTV